MTWNEPYICPICQKDYRGDLKGRPKLKQHIIKKEDVFHRLLSRYKRGWPDASYWMCMKELKPKMDRFIEEYGKSEICKGK